MAFGALIVGLAGGTIAFAGKTEWAWIFPPASFVGYILAFRRGMLLWDRNIDWIWRRPPSLEAQLGGEDEEALPAAEDPERTLRIVRRESPSLERHETGVVR